jgi:hypothetical protein
MDETTRLFIDDNLNNLDNINGDMSPKSAVPTEKVVLVVKVVVKIKETIL